MNQGPRFFPPSYRWSRYHAIANYTLLKRNLQIGSFSTISSAMYAFSKERNVKQLNSMQPTITKDYSKVSVSQTIF